jgi:hypothetical protein
MRTGLLYRGVKRRKYEADHSPHPRLSLRISGAIHLLPIYVFMALTERTLPSLYTNGKHE